MSCEQEWVGGCSVIEEKLTARVWEMREKDVSEGLIRTKCKAFLEEINNRLPSSEQIKCNFSNQWIAKYKKRTSLNFIEAMVKAARLTLPQ